MILMHSKESKLFDNMRQKPYSECRTIIHKQGEGGNAMDQPKAKKTCWAVIGGGNGGHATAGHLGIMGFSVRLYDIVEETVDALNRKGGIEVQGQVEGVGKLEFATTDMERALNGADIVMVVAPALAHR